MASSTSCPMCGGETVAVVERVNVAVVVFACDDCSATWADRETVQEGDQ